jgi:hypothetical protein
MRNKFLSLLFFLFMASCHGQAIFTYDQQSADEANFLEGSSPLGPQPFGQSFTPSLSSVDFIRIFVTGGALGDGTIYVNLRGDSITGPVLGSTSPVTVSLATQGFVTFFFGSPVAVAPGTTYFFQPVLQSGGGWAVNTSQFYNYAGGTLYSDGVASANVDMWFREGIVVPEPSSTVLVLVGALLAGFAQLRSRHRN